MIPNVLLGLCVTRLFVSLLIAMWMMIAHFLQDASIQFVCLWNVERDYLALMDSYVVVKSVSEQTAVVRTQIVSRAKSVKMAAVLNPSIVVGIATAMALRPA
jgi:hypothetical protein